MPLVTSPLPDNYNPLFMINQTCVPRLLNPFSRCHNSLPIHSLIFFNTFLKNNSLPFPQVRCAPRIFTPPPNYDTFWLPDTAAFPFPFPQKHSTNKFSSPFRHCCSHSTIPSTRFLSALRTKLLHCKTYLLHHYYSVPRQHNLPILIYSFCSTSLGYRDRTTHHVLTRL